MTGNIDFKIIEQKSTFLHPQKEFSPTVESFQVRADPFAGRRGHFTHFGAIKPQKLNLDVYNTPDIKGFCPFYLENRDTLPGVIEVHLSRLAYQWEIRINKTIDEVKDQALGYVKDELATIDALLSNIEPQTVNISADIEELKGIIERITA